MCLRGLVVRCSSLAVVPATSVSTFGTAVKGQQLPPDEETEVYSYSVPAALATPNGTAATVQQLWAERDTTWLRFQETVGAAHLRRQ
eukprot:2406208-Prymnesium_polylepis.1